MKSKKNEKTKTASIDCLYLISCIGARRARCLYQLPNRADYPISFYSNAVSKHENNFENIGIGVGTEISHSGNNQTWVQGISLVWHRNKATGNGIGLYTQTITRPSFSDSFFGEVKLGIGYQYLFRPANSFQLVDGKWKSVNKKGKGMLMIPFNIGLGYLENVTNPRAHYASYQWMVLKGYNASVPFFPQSAILFGSRIHH